MRLTARLGRGVLGMIVVLPGVALAACGGPDGISEGGEGGPTGWVGSGGYGGGTTLHDGGGLTGDGGLAARDGGIGVSGDGGAGADAGMNGGGGGPPTDASMGPPDGASSQGDAGIGVVFNEPPGFFVSLDWIISGPASYSGTVFLGDAHSIEFVVGGVLAGGGYTITLSGVDRDGLRCSGTSAPFTVVAGEVTGAGVVIECPVPADAGALGLITVGVAAADAAP